MDDNQYPVWDKQLPQSRLQGFRRAINAFSSRRDQNSPPPETDESARGTEHRLKPRDRPERPPPVAENWYGPYTNVPQQAPAAQGNYYDQPSRYNGYNNSIGGNTTQATYGPGGQPSYSNRPAPYGRHSDSQQNFYNQNNGSHGYNQGQGQQHYPPNTGYSNPQSRYNSQDEYTYQQGYPNPAQQYGYATSASPDRGQSPQSYQGSWQEPQQGYQNHEAGSYQQDNNQGYGDGSNRGPYY